MHFFLRHHITMQFLALTPYCRFDGTCAQVQLLRVVQRYAVFKESTSGR